MHEDRAVLPHNGIPLQKGTYQKITQSTTAANSSPELKMAMETWKEIKFEFETVDKLDVG